MAAAIHTTHLPRRWSVALVQGFSMQDAVVGGYLLVLLAIVLGATGPGQAQAEQAVLIDVAVFAIGLCITRGELISPRGFAGAALYRVLGPVVMFMSYFQLRVILPAVSSAAFDLDIYAFDLAVFGVEPALYLDRFVTPARTEWFSFFYFGYFVLLAVYLSLMSFLCRDEVRLTSFALGIFLLFGTGQLLYMVVPGYGPYAALAAHFVHPLEGPTFWVMVRETVEAGGAMKDIFPSLHTAVPTFLALFSFRHRRRVPALRWLWPVVALIATQIILATMYLRWHYLVDVVAGLMLAFAVDVLADRIGRWEVAKRERLGRPPVFESFPAARRPRS